jgi:hypothetical protein
MYPLAFMLHMPRKLLLLKPFQALQSFTLLFTLTPNIRFFILSSPFIPPTHPKKIKALYLQTEVLVFPLSSPLTPLLSPFPSFGVVLPFMSAALPFLCHNANAFKGVLF